MGTGDSRLGRPAHAADDLCPRKNSRQAFNGSMQVLPPVFWRQYLHTPKTKMPRQRGRTIRQLVGKLACSGVSVLTTRKP